MRKNSPLERVIIHSYHHEIEIWQTLFNFHEHVIELGKVDVAGGLQSCVDVALFCRACLIYVVRHLGMNKRLKRKGLKSGLRRLSCPGALARVTRKRAPDLVPGKSAESSRRRFANFWLGLSLDPGNRA